MRIDPHSYADDRQPIVHELDWKASIDFERRVIGATAHLEFLHVGAGPLDLDTRDLKIEAVEDSRGAPLAYELGAPEPIYGQRLRVHLPPESDGIRIRYETSTHASALQWLTPAQTAGGKLPFLFSQCQAIHARSVVPLQDTPRRRIRYRAELEVPRAMRALMAAGFAAREEAGDRALERYEMPQPIPPYLLALAVGDLVSRDLAPRSRVWAEPKTIERAAYEFAEVDAMLVAAEKLFGPYDWDRFDFLVLPPSFPYGGMENPRLTFLTPTVLAGDRSLVDVLAHELAHSWAGNLVTNATAEHFWLNEGLTVYAERRIIEALHGADVGAISAALGWQSLEEAVDDFKERPELTRLRTHLQGIDPDEAYSTVPYEKGYLLFKALEDAAGRDVFDRFLREYLARFRFTSITTEEFADFVERSLPGALAKIEAGTYFEGEGIPSSAIRPKSDRLEAIENLGNRLPSEDQARRWIASEWQFWLNRLDRKVTLSECEQIDRRFSLTRSGNFEVLVSWLEPAIHAGYEPAISKAEALLGEVGRMKYLKPLYRALAGRNADRAREIFERNRAVYHPIAVQVVDALLKGAHERLAIELVLAPGKAAHPKRNSSADS
ncbi:MAG TPA: M1 family metallopeptidase [Gammaproteobacteria bacterium]|nr:M1 family metallopeptidase [Gammaproteobacteria bacterium]